MRILQSDPKVHPWLQKNGCTTMSILDVAGQDLDAQELNDFYEAALAEKCYTKDGLVMWKPMLEFVNKRFGTRLRFKHFASCDYIPKQGEREILWFYLSPSTPSHFTSGDGTGRISYDPLGNTTAPKHWKLLGKRIIILEAA